MSDVAEKRVYDDAAGDRTAFVAGAQGVVAVRVSAGHVGRFGLVDDRAARDVAAAPPGAASTAGAESAAEAAWPPVAVAAADGVRVGDADRLSPAGFGPAVAVGFDGDALLAAGPDGRVARAESPHDWGDDSPESTAVEWTDLGTVGDVRAIDGPLVAAADGVYRVAGDELTPAGLADVRDVAAAGPLAATDDGLYRLGNGWQDVLDGAFGVVAAERGGRNRAHAGRAAGRDGSDDSDDGGDDSHADSDAALWTRRDGEWTTVDLPESVAGETVVDVGYGAATYAVTEAGTLLASGGGPVGAGEVGDGEAGTADGGGATTDDWRAHALGVREVVALAVAGGGDGT